MPQLIRDTSQIDQLVRLDLQQGRMADLTVDGIAISADVAVERGLAHGDTLPLTFYEDDDPLRVDVIFGAGSTAVDQYVVSEPFGITNTLALSVFERTRELGLLRAVGMTREQVPVSVRWELVAALADVGFVGLVLPGRDLALQIVIAALAGVIAAIGPARRADGLPPVVPESGRRT